MVDISPLLETLERYLTAQVARDAMQFVQQLRDMKYIDRRRRVEQVIQRAQLFYAVNGSGRWTGLSRCIVIKQSIEQALRKHGVHRLSSMERLRHEREHGENVRDEVWVDDFGMMQEI